MKGCVVIPSFNEAKIIYQLILEIKKLGFDVLVINDGSRDETEMLAKKAGAEVISHSRNMGKGASLRSGFQKVINEDYDFIVTMDGDGQHRPEDIKNFVEVFSAENADIIVGNRMDEPKNMPFPRWTTNKIMSMVISSICKTYIPDTQCGFRLIKTSVLKDIVLSTSNYEIESELLIQASKSNYKIKSVPIRTIYEGQASQINPLVDTVRFLRFILKDQLKEVWLISKEFFSDTFIKQSAIIFFASFFCNVLNLAFWLFMVRRLTPVDYGILNSMVSFLTVASLPITIVQTVLTRYFSEYNALEKIDSTKALFRAFLKRIIIANIVIMFFFLAISKNIASFLNLNSQVFVYLTIFSIFFSNLLVLTSSTLQGLQLFPSIAVNSIFQGFTKIFSGITLVLFGFKAVGAYLGFIFSGFFGFVLSLFQLPPWVLKMGRKEYDYFKPAIKLKDIYGYFFPVAIALISYTLLTNSDMILVKHFFSETETGIYSIAQTVGKIVLFLPSAITLVFFPVTVQQRIENKKTAPLLKRSLLFVALACLMVIIFTLIFPKFVLRVISGRALPECIPLVRLVIFPMSLFALSYIFVFYNLSLRNTGFIISIFAISVIQIVLIYLFHSTLLQVIGILTLSSASVFCLGLKSISKKE